MRRLTGVADEAVRLDRIRDPGDFFEGEVDADSAADFTNIVIELARTLSTTELERQIAIPLDAFLRHVRVQLKGAPSNRWVLTGPQRQGAFQSPFADKAPRADRIGVDVNFHGVFFGGIK